VLLASFFSELAVCKDVELYLPSGEQVSNYKELLMGLQPDDILLFDQGRRRFRFEGYLGHGATTEVLKVTPLYRARADADTPVALRLPIDVGSTSYDLVRHETPFRSYITEFRDGMSQLKKDGIRIPKEYSAFKDQFVAVELVKTDFDMKSFFLEPEKHSPEDIKNAEEALYKFAEQTSGYKAIGDFHLEQIAFDAKNKEWILMDFTSKHKKINFVTGRDDSTRDIFSLAKYTVEAGLSPPRTDQANKNPYTGLGTDQIADLEKIRHQKQDRAGKIFRNIRNIIAENSTRPKLIMQTCRALLNRLPH